MSKYKIMIDRRDLTISWCDPITLDTIKVKKFKTLDELEKYIYSL